MFKLSKCHFELITQNCIFFQLLFHLSTFLFFNACDDSQICIFILNICIQSINAAKNSMFSLTVIGSYYIISSLLSS